MKIRFISELRLRKRKIRFISESAANGFEMFTRRSGRVRSDAVFLAIHGTS